MIATYRPHLTGSGDAVRGRAVFATHCASCHRIAGVGQVIGPDISDTYNKSAESLLTSILDPDRAIDGRYVAYNVAVDDGRILAGLVEAETTATVTIRTADGKATTLSRERIEAIRPAGVSLMPTGLERQIDPPAMADLIEFLQTWREQNTPE